MPQLLQLGGHGTGTDGAIRQAGGLQALQGDRPRQPFPVDHGVAVGMGKIQQFPILDKTHGQQHQGGHILEAGVDPLGVARPVHDFAIVVQQLQARLGFFLVDAIHAALGQFLVAPGQPTLAGNHETRLPHLLLDGGQQGVAESHIVGAAIRRQAVLVGTGLEAIIDKRGKIRQDASLVGIRAQFQHQQDQTA